MAEKPPIEEVAKDLADIRAELEAMRVIREKAIFLIGRSDVNSDFYRRVAYNIGLDVIQGECVEGSILKHYPDLK